MPPSLDNQADALNTKPPAQTDARFAFSHQHLVFVSDIGLAGWEVALNLSRHERTTRTGDTSVYACIIVILIIDAVLQLVFDPDDTRPSRRARRRAAASVCPGPVAVGPPFPLCKVKHATTATTSPPPPRSASHATALTDADRMMAAGISLSLRSAGGRWTD